MTTLPAVAPAAPSPESAPHPHTAETPRRAMPVGVTLGMATFGVFWGAWAVCSANVLATFHVGAGRFGLLMTVALAASVASNLVTGSLVARFGTPAVCRAALGSFGLLVSTSALMPDAPAFACTLAAAMAAAGVVDVAVNVAASSQLASAPGRLLRFHARYSTGAALGAGACAGALQLGATWREVLLAAGVLAAALALVPGKAFGPRVERGDGPRAPHPLAALRLLPSERLLLLGGVLAGAALVEGGINVWGVLVARDQLRLGVLAGAGGFVAGQALAACARLGGGHALARVPTRWGTVAGAGAAAAGLLTEAASPSAAAAVAGLALASVAISLCWPLVMSDTFLRSADPEIATAGVSACGYLGVMAGPALVGAVAAAGGLRIGLAALSIVAAATALVRALSSSPGAAPGSR